jgi:hypothetical protein
MLAASPVHQYYSAASRRNLAGDTDAVILDKVWNQACSLAAITGIVGTSVIWIRKIADKMPEKRV